VRRRGAENPRAGLQRSRSNPSPSELALRSQPAKLLPDAESRREMQRPTQPRTARTGNSTQLTRLDVRAANSELVAPQQRPGQRSRNVKNRRAEQAKRVQPLAGAKDSAQRNRQQPAQRRQQRTSPLIHVVRLLILGIGIGAIAGTVISIWDPTMRYPAEANHANSPQQAGLQGTGQDSVMPPVVMSLRAGQEITQLTAKVTPLVQNLTDLTPGVFVIDADSGNYLSINGTSTFSAASMIKVPVLVAFFQDVDAGKIRLDDKLTLQQGDLAQGSGEMQYDGVGTQYSALDTVTKMITISDNTATNMLIRRLGGIEALNQRFRQWGLQQTAIHKPLPDLEGTNTTSPKELVTLLTLMSQGKLLSMKSRDRAIDIMHHTVTDTLLPSAMGTGATAAHKTGDIGSLIGDTGIIDLPSGKRYIITAMVKRPFNDDRAGALIRQIAATVYGYFDPSYTGANILVPPQGADGTTTPGAVAPGVAPGSVAPTPGAPGTPVNGNFAPAPNPAVQQGAPLAPAANPYPPAPMTPAPTTPPVGTEGTAPQDATGAATPSPEPEGSTPPAGGTTDGTAIR
jgi:beta-lactamase class A